MGWDTAKDVGLFALGVYGAVLSSLNWWNANQRDKRRIRVKISTAMPTYTNGQVGAPFACIEAVNIGHRDVTITSLSLEIGDKHLAPLSQNTFPGIADTVLPAVLKDGGTAQLFLAYAEIGHALVDIGLRSKTSVVPYCQDSSGEKYRGSPWEIDPVEMMNTH